MAGKRGRPSRLTPALIGKIAEHVATGLYPEPAASLECVPRSTFHKWLSKGRTEAKGLPHELVCALERAEAQHQQRLNAVLNMAIDARDPHFALKALGARHAAKYAPRSVVHASSSKPEGSIEGGNDPVKHLMEKLEKLRAGARHEWATVREKFPDEFEALLAAHRALVAKSTPAGLEVPIHLLDEVPP